MNIELTCLCGEVVTPDTPPAKKQIPCPACGAMLDIPVAPEMSQTENASRKMVGSEMFQTLGIAPGQQWNAELPTYLLNDNKDLLTYRLCISVEPQAAESPYITEVMDAFLYELADALHGRFQLEIKPWNETITNAAAFRVLLAGLSNPGIFGLGRRYTVMIDGDLLSDEYPTSFVHLKKVGTTDAILVKAARMLAQKASKAIIEHQIR